MQMLPQRAVPGGQSVLPGPDRFVVGVRPFLAEVAVGVGGPPPVGLPLGPPNLAGSVPSALAISSPPNPVATTAPRAMMTVRRDTPRADLRKCEIPCRKWCTRRGDVFCS